MNVPPQYFTFTKHCPKKLILQQFTMYKNENFANDGKLVFLPDYFERYQVRKQNTILMNTHSNKAFTCNVYT